MNVLLFYLLSGSCRWRWHGDKSANANPTAIENDCMKKRTTIYFRISIAMRFIWCSSSTEMDWIGLDCALVALHGCGCVRAQSKMIYICHKNYTQIKLNKIKSIAFHSRAPIALLLFNSIRRSDFISFVSILNSFGSNKRALYYYI